MTLNLDGKNVVITGGSRGLGECLVRRFLSYNANVITCARHMDELQKLKSSVVACKGTLTTFKTDLSKSSEIKRFCGAVQVKFGRVDVLVNNAGVPGPSTGISGINPVNWDAVINTNVRAAMLLVKEFRPIFSKNAAILNISSCLGLTGSPDKTPYDLSKAALNMFTKDLSRELGPAGIRVNSVAPTIMPTTFRNNRDVIAKNKRAILRSIPLGIIPSLDDVANAVLFLCSDLAASISGVILPVDGGRGI